MTLDEAKASTGLLVRILRGFGHTRNRNCGRILGTEGGKVVLQVFGRHPKPEKMPPESLKLWKGGNNRLGKERKRA
jgi:hypothetical protein